MEKIIRGNLIQSIEDFHAEIKRSLELSNYYGENFDALWDCLTGYIETPITIVWEDFKSSKTSLGDDANKIVSIFDDAEKEIEGFIIIYR